MKKITNHHSSLFLIELMINLLIFLTIIGLCMQFFIKSTKLTETSKELHSSAIICNRISNIYSHGNTGFDSLLEAFPYSTDFNQNLVIYFDKNFVNTQERKCKYYCLVKTIKSRDHYDKIIISCYRKNKKKEIYSIKTTRYVQKHVQDYN
ncbi:hypothetical protein [Lachnobacterium bovis]|uniref:hypothetical protein n=1 Tax=Lachnobacterium bovis TaxID=140626 RepID=UPI000490CFE3|nr:hypothetical protein [Lachnobacterium bovis]